MRMFWVTVAACTLLILVVLFSRDGLTGLFRGRGK